MKFIVLAILAILIVVFYIRQQNHAKIIKSNQLLGQYFLANNAQQQGVVSTSSGLQYLILENRGKSAKPSASSTVTVHYHGSLLNGLVFDSSVERAQPAQFPLGQVIRGWTEGLQLMHEGDKYRFFIPSHLAYGERSIASIPAGSTLIFEVELLSIDTP
ncbi:MULTISPECIES: FKBP-type peptidyl-prolyl cis-trans isomerase [unclassified Agarivorans]|uniref:FKBP-type peptidyl-prolyl cis-trans isomerase n=1 Tax=unclassified Agarivorans TaxID=2636026 RepID=UPI003D7EAC88